MLENISGMKKFVVNDYLSHLSIDCVIFGYQTKELKVLLSKFKFGQGSWSLPGGHILKTEGTDQAASRLLKQRTGLENIYLEQFRVFGRENRITDSNYREIVKADLRQYGKQWFDEEAIDWITSRFVSIGYYALVNMDNVTPLPGEFDEYLEWYPVNGIPEMIHDHSEILTVALETLRQTLDQKLIGFNLLPETFTMREVQELYEAVYNKAFPINNFQKKMLDLNVLERLQKKYTGAANTAPYLYRFKK